ncbi:C2H2-type domain-containing protein [Caenorhabditis elegans]|nr:C2H2-type domain-containing protein [Caenorhabditis elegans]CDH93024.1 C2H2-type domain-containing protein [Caenorhabditis elegans]|eukprot:NP_001294318.1 EGR (Early Growth factor Response factor) Homolog [Caenorhabditis elegans]
MILNGSMQSPNSNNLNMMIPATTFKLQGGAGGGASQASAPGGGSSQQPNPLEIRSLIAQNR